MTDERRRFRVTNIEITAEQRAILDRYLPWGTQHRLFKHLIDDLCVMLEADGPRILAGIYMREIHAADILKIGDKDGRPEGLASEHIGNVPGGPPESAT